MDISYMSRIVLCGYLVLMGYVTLPTPTPLSWDTVVSSSGQSVQLLSAASAALAQLQAGLQRIKLLPRAP